jgi:acyl-CoA dehydrogenase
VTDPEKGARGISLFLVDKGMPGFTLGRDQKMMGLRGTSHVELAFDDVELGPEHLLGEEGTGLSQALAVLGRVRLAQIGARSVGKATAILNLALDHARERRQFGQALGEFQMVQQMLADSAIEINAARLALLQTAWLIDRGQDPRAQISMVKVQASETLGRVADRAVQVFGGLGYCKDLPIERYYRDARIYRIFDGASEIHRGVVARALMKQGAGLFDLAE